MSKIFTIGFTQKTAEKFFSILQDNNINVVIDVRLNNISQLAGFSKYPDIEFFLRKICDINYIHDLHFAPAESTLSRYKKKVISWDQYVDEFEQTMTKRNITQHIKENFNPSEQTICLLCSEPTAEHCHRRLIAERFGQIFEALEIVHLK